MKSFTQIGLPILLVVVAVFLITVVTQYSSQQEDPSPVPVGPSSKDANGKTSKEPPLKFYTTQVGATNRDTAPKYLKYWVPEIEIDQPSYYVYWAANKHEQPVTIRSTGANCQCASVEYANVPPDALKQYATLSAFANSPLMGGTPMPLLSLLAHSQLASKLDWQLLYNKEKTIAGEVNPASPTTGPQFVAVRMNWSGKPPEGPKTIAANVVCNLPEASPIQTGLSASILIVPPFNAYRREFGGWSFLTDLNLGEIREGGQSRQEFFVASASKPYLTLSHSFSVGQNPCIQVSDPIPATVEEMNSLAEFAPKGEPLITRVTCMYKISVNVQERVTTTVNDKTETVQMDLGPIDRWLTIKSDAGGSKLVQIKGRILGDVRILSGADSGQIDFGRFLSDQDQRKDLMLIAERPGLDLEIAQKEVIPNFLKVKLEPQPDIDNRKHWKLSVVIPENYETLPVNSVIILKTKEDPPRKIRLPVRGAGYTKDK